MARPLRIEFENAIYHLTARGNERRPVFRADGDRKQFLTLLARSCERFEVSLLVLVLMGNHFHLVGQTHRGNLSRWMHWLMVSYTTWFNWRHDRSGHLFQGRYKSFLVEEGEYLLELSRYLHLNPVRGKLLGRGESGGAPKAVARVRLEQLSRLRGFSAAPCFCEGGNGPGGDGWSAPRESGALSAFCGGRPVAGDRESTGSGTVAGGAGERELCPSNPGSDERFAERTSGSDGSAARESGDGLAGGGEAPRVPVRRLQEKGSHGLEARNVALWLIWEKCGLSQRELGELFGGMNYAAVARRLRRLKPESRRTAEKLMDELSR